MEPSPSTCIHKLSPTFAPTPKYQLGCKQGTSRRALDKWNMRAAAVKFPAPAQSSWKCVEHCSVTSPYVLSRTDSTVANCRNFMAANCQCYSLASKALETPKETAVQSHLTWQFSFNPGKTSNLENWIRQSSQSWKSKCLQAIKNEKPDNTVQGLVDCAPSQAMYSTACRKHTCNKKVAKILNYK